MTIRSYLHNVGIGLLLHGSPTRPEVGEVSISALSSGLEEYSLNIEFTENCDGSVTLAYEDCETCIPDRPFYPQDDFLRGEKWWSDVRWDQVPKKQYRKFDLE
jgi:hypothetical protein